MNLNMNSKNYSLLLIIVIKQLKYREINNKKSQISFDLTKKLKNHQPKFRPFCFFGLLQKKTKKKQKTKKQLLPPLASRPTTVISHFGIKI